MSTHTDIEIQTIPQLQWNIINLFKIKSNSCFKLEVNGMAKIKYSSPWFLAHLHCIVFILNCMTSNPLKTKYQPEYKE